jgi:hypothetical protein
MKVTIPDEIMNDKAVRDAIASAQRQKTAPQMKQKFSQTVDGWENRPEWSQKQEIETSRIAISVWASGRNENQYRMVNEGAKPHPIYPRNPRGLLRFQPGYISATRPGSMKSSRKQRFGDFVLSRGVSHPGFEPRLFDEQVAEAIGDDFASDMQDAIKSASKAK